MFSPLGRSRFDVDESSHIANLLDSLSDAGFEGRIDLLHSTIHCRASAAVGMRPLLTTFSLMTHAGVDRMSYARISFISVTLTKSA